MSSACTFTTSAINISWLLFDGQKAARAAATPKQGNEAGGSLSEPASAPAEIAPAVWNRPEALAALDDDEDLLRRLARVLCEDLRSRETHMAAAQNASDSATLRRLAHAVKNSAGAMRLDLLRARAGEAERSEDSTLPASVERMRHAMREALLLLEAEPGCMQSQEVSVHSAGAALCSGAASQKGEC